MLVVYNDDTFTCYQASVNNISYLKDTIASIIFGLSMNTQKHEIVDVIHSGRKLKDDVLTYDQFQTKSNNHVNI